jgi:gliding motility-associated-like protein
VNYSWRPPVGLNNANISNPVFSHDNDMEYQVRIRQATGCQATDTVLVRVHKEGEVFVPRAWSPNNDGRNDYLYPIMVGMMELKLFRVYNRWGQLMFETTQPRQGWNGVASGQPQAIDTYTWTVEAVYPDGKILKRTGNSILMR